MHDTRLDSSMDQDSTLDNEISHVRTLVLSGGGILGCAHIGFLRCLQEKELLQYPLVLHGTSVGCLIGLMLCLKMSPQEQLSTMKYMNSNLMDLENLANLDTNFGLDKGEYFCALLIDLMHSHGLSHSTTLQELFEYSQVDLNCHVTNLYTCQSEVWNRHTQPTMPVFMAVRAAASIPFLISPVQHEGMSYVDGGITCNYPFPKTDAKHTLGCNLISYERSRVNSIDSLCIAMFNCLLRRSSLAPSVADRTVVVSCTDMKLMDFDCSALVKQDLEQRGYDAAMEFLKQKTIVQETNCSNNCSNGTPSDTCVISQETTEATRKVPTVSL